MYYVVRKDRSLSFGQAMAMGGAGAVACVDRFWRSEFWAASFAAWRATSSRKITLRADREQFDRVAELDSALIATDAGPAMLCLPPRRKSEREILLTELEAFTDARQPSKAPEVPTGALVYVIRADVFKNMGKAIAHGGHAALKLVNRLSTSHGPELQRWRAQGYPGEVRLADEQMWEYLKTEVECISIKDAGSTQVARGTETVLALPPLAEQPDLVKALERVA
jgi:peptidyl-tRNA hydrolase